MNEDQINEISARATAVSEKLQAFDQEKIVDANLDYYMEVIAPAASKFADAGFALIDLIQGNAAE